MSEQDSITTDAKETQKEETYKGKTLKIILH